MGDQRLRALEAAKVLVRTVGESVKVMSECWELEDGGCGGEAAGKAGQRPVNLAEAGVRGLTRGGREGALVENEGSTKEGNVV